MATVTGGEKLAQKLREISQNVRKAATLRVGFMGDAHYDDDHGNVSVALVAAINEFGQTRIHPNQPPRPFFRNMIGAKSPEWPEKIAKLLEATDYDAAAVLNLMGEEISDDLKQSILDFTSPGLADSTIARKAKGMSADAIAKAKASASGPAKPLIDTGLMLKSVTYEVDE